MGDRLRRLARASAAAAAALGGALLLAAPAGGASTPDAPEARRLFLAGDYAGALALYRALALAPPSTGGAPGEYLDGALSCLFHLGRDAEADALRARYAEVHAGDWRALADLARSWISGRQEGFLVAGVFERGPGRGEGSPVRSTERDRARAVRGMARALALAGADRSGPERGGAGAAERAALRLRAAEVIMFARDARRAWRLRELTALDGPLPELRDAAEPRREERAAAVGVDGQPLFHKVPASWESAASDGERWRWLLDAARHDDPALARRVRRALADFSRSQFGVQTLADYPELLADDADRGSGGELPGEWSLRTLAEDETIARLATGVRRFRLAPDWDFVAAYRALADGDDSHASDALRALAEIFESRHQLDRAAEAWRRLLAGFPGAFGPEPGQRLAQIVEPRGEFEGAGTFVAGEPAQIGFRFRNARAVRLEARRIDVPRLLADVRAYLEDDPATLERERVDVDDVGWRVVSQGQEKYLGAAAASWRLDLEPDPGHRDRRLSVETPPLDPGAYLLTARVDDGNEARIVVWISDTVLVHKRLEGGAWFFAADAATGEPLPGLELDFLGYRQEPAEWQRETGRRLHVRTRSFRAATDASGQLVPDPGLLAGDHTWLVSATGAGRLAYLGWGPVWGGRRARREYRETKAYAITDRPAYRPGQTVRLRLWVQEARYDAAGRSPHAGRVFTLQMHDALGGMVLERTVEADSFGGITADLLIPADAAPGLWRVGLSGFGGGSFRVEEHRETEFEATVEGPPEPVELGARATAVVRARSRSGAPVTGATVLYRVRRTPLEARWYPPGEWDWCFGAGYWWFTPDYPWYPGWERWGTPRPRPSWRPRPQPRPELVAEREVPLGPDGEARIEIDTALAGALHGDEDHRYEIVAEVTDRSRRTVVAGGEVLAARRPFAVRAWVDRGHYRAGDTVRAEVQARAVGGAPVGGVAQVVLHSIGYVDGVPAEKAVRRWTLRLDAQGGARLQLTTAAAGQYRLAATVTDPSGRSAEGGSVFTVAGPAFEGADLRFNELELVPDRREYAPGDTVQLRVNAARRGAAVLLFPRPENGVYDRPRLVRLTGNSALEQIEVGREDLPGFFLEALTVSRGRVFTEVREIVVPPAGKALGVEVLPSSERFAPGEEARVRLRVTGPGGEPAAGTAVLAVYDRAVEQAAGGSNVPDVRAFFWKWRRTHAPAAVTSADRRFVPLHREGERVMLPVGLFGAEVPDGPGAGGPGEEERTPGVGPAGATGAQREAPEEVADTAYWAPALELGADGAAEASFRMPESLAGWKLRCWALGEGAAVGEGEASAVTAKNLLVRLEAPRFLVERDEAVLSASVVSFLDVAAAVEARLELEGGCLEAIDDEARSLEIAPGGEARAQWRVRAVREGAAVVRVRAVAAGESDAMELRFPVLVHGMEQTVGWSGSIRPGEESTGFSFTIPPERRVDQTRLEVRFSPTLAGALVDALPALAESPYDSTEQTLNRFLPAVILRRTLGELGLPLEELRRRRADLAVPEPPGPGARARQGRRLVRDPVFDGEALGAVTHGGLARLAAMQLPDGGWGWFSGWGERSGPHATAVVVHGLQAAAAASVRLPDGVLERGLSWLERWLEREVGRLRRAGDWKERADELDALVFATLAESGREQAAMRGFLVRDRARLAPAGLAHLGLGLERAGQRDLLAATLRTLDQHVVENAESRTAWLRLPDPGAGHWWGSETETLAAYLRLLARTDPRGARTAGVARYLLDHRRHGAYWDSTRDTALCVEALAELLGASGEQRTDLTVEILLDGKRQREVRVEPEGLLALDNAVVLEGAALAAGPHTIEVRRRGTGPLYASAWLSFHTLEDFAGEAGLEVRCRRAVYRLRRPDRDATEEEDRGREPRRGPERQPLADGEEVASGDLLEVELTLESGSDHEYLVVEDPRAAGLEPLEGLDGYQEDGVGAYLELHDTRGVFFLRALPRGTTRVSYRLRAETPGRYVALPARISAMYAPQLRGSSAPFHLEIVDGRR